MKRVVTGHDKSGKSIFVSEGEPPKQVTNAATSRLTLGLSLKSLNCSCTRSINKPAISALCKRPKPFTVVLLGLSTCVSRKLNFW